jgi:nucleoid-associated protein YgaU
MKRLSAFLLIILLAAGCATTSKDKKPAGPVEGPATEEAKISASLECIEIAAEARKKGNISEEKAALGLALKYLREVDTENRQVLNDSTETLRSLIAISGFEYASKESNELLVVYMEMQNAYADHDSEKIKVLKAAFDAKFENARIATTEAKQKKIDALGKEVVIKKDDTRKQGEPDSGSALPSIYTVKKGDTLPSVAARHDIYNDSFMWPLIYKANRDQIKDPKVLYGGQELKIPRDMSLEEIIQARREAGAGEPEKIPKDALIPRRTK